MLRYATTHSVCVYLEVALPEGVSLDDHAASLCPVGAVGVALAGEGLARHVRTGWRARLPAVAKLQPGAGTQQVIGLAGVEVPTQTTHSALQAGIGGG